MSTVILCQNANDEAGFFYRYSFVDMYFNAI